MSVLWYNHEARTTPLCLLFRYRFQREQLTQIILFIILVTQPCGLQAIPESQLYQVETPFDDSEICAGSSEKPTRALRESPEPRQSMDAATPSVLEPLLKTDDIAETTKRVRSLVEVARSYFKTLSSMM
jgi:hypothetical protein